MIVNYKFRMMWQKGVMAYSHKEIIPESAWIRKTMEDLSQDA
jgi:hypothetical protein